jgi:hypothetical protein
LLPYFDLPSNKDLSTGIALEKIAISESTKLNIAIVKQFIYNYTEWMPIFLRMNIGFKRFI